MDIKRAAGNQLLSQFRSEIGPSKAGETTFSEQVVVRVIELK